MSALRYLARVRAPTTTPAVLSLRAGLPRNFSSSVSRLSQPAAGAEFEEFKTDIPEWIPKLLDETEGGGYTLSHAGLPGLPVAWGDMDAFGHVNNVKYLKWFETGECTVSHEWGIVKC